MTRTNLTNKNYVLFGFDGVNIRPVEIIEMTEAERQLPLREKFAKLGFVNIRTYLGRTFAHKSGQTFALIEANCPINVEAIKEFHKWFDVKL